MQLLKDNHEITAMIGGRYIHSVSAIVGGVSKPITEEERLAILERSNARLSLPKNPWPYLMTLYWEIPLMWT
jgi:coenzyme F420-reducing hydrogenase alpha subunit